MSVHVQYLELFPRCLNSDHRRSTTSAFQGYVTRNSLSAPQKWTHSTRLRRNHVPCSRMLQLFDTRDRVKHISREVASKQSTPFLASRHNRNLGKGKLLPRKNKHPRRCSSRRAIAPKLPSPEFLHIREYLFHLFTCNGVVSKHGTGKQQRIYCTNHP